MPLMSAIPAGFASTVTKTAAIVGGNIVGGMAVDYIIDSIRSKDQPQIAHAILMPTKMKVRVYWQLILVGLNLGWSL